MFVLFVKPTIAQVSLYNHYPKAMLEQVIPMPMQFAPVPLASDSFWREKIPFSIRYDYIMLGEKYLGMPWNAIPNSLFSEYESNGVRINYEKKNFELRRRLACLVMGELMEYRGRFLPDIFKGLNYFLSEIWWGVPAHYPEKLPRYSLQTVDLFNAETANLLAWTIFLLREKLDSIDNCFCKKLQNEIKRRFLDPSRNDDYFWKSRVSNWNPWICSNWLSCVLLCEDNRWNQIESIQQILRCLDIYFDGNPQDGGCDEGITYWVWGAVSYYVCLELLWRASGGKISLIRNKKLKAMCNYAANLYIGNSNFVNFADSRSKASISPHVLLPFGKYVNDTTMMQFGKYTFVETNYLLKPSRSFLTSGNYPSLSRELLFLSQLDYFNSITPREPFKRDSYLPSLQICTGRNDNGSRKGLYFAAKGGHNGENHNHNDIGNFIVYFDGNPVIIDIGIGTYKKSTFDKHRYELFNCRSSYHNVPIINGLEQCAGQNYKSKNVQYKSSEKFSQFVLDLADAYPDNADVLSWERTIDFYWGKKMVITEDFLLKTYQAPSVIVLVCVGHPLRVEGGIDINSGAVVCHIRFNSSELRPEFEKIEHNDVSLYYDWGGKDLYRIKLTILGETLKGKIRYSIS